MAAVIGDPVAHSLSPAIHNAAFAAAGLDWVFVALPVAAGEAPTAVAGARALGIDGLSVTMPHKAAVIPSLDGLSPVAAELGAVNCIHRDPADPDRWLGHNTDGEGFLAGLRADLALDPSGLEVVVLGAGGAARAVVRALGGAGARVAVAARRSDAAVEAAALGGPDARAVPAGGIAAVVSGAALVVNATPVGMAGRPGVPLDPELLGPGHAVVDLIYHPLDTDLLRAARAAGAATANGLSMLVHQAAAAFTRWTGEQPPLRAMEEAARAAVA
ncbi:MAG: shikimate dehydrogenase [Microthrixaceae bacterium]